MAPDQTPADPGDSTGPEPGPDDAITPETPPEPERPLLTLRDGLPEVVETPEALAAACADMAAGTGPVALDAERASGYRYSARAYLIQLRREGSTTWLVDPTALDSLAPLQEVLAEPEWVLHAATQDLPCLREVGLEPRSLFDTELAARLLGYPRVGLAALVESICELRMRKEHSAADWSKRPLPRAWLDYAALDVEVLVEIRDVLAEQLESSGKLSWAHEEFEHVLHQRPMPRVDPWRRTSGMHRARGRRQVAAVRELWISRDDLAERRDVTPGRLIPDAAIVAAASALPRTRADLLATPGFHGRGASRYSDVWLEALDAARDLPDSELPPVSLPANGPPPIRAWPDRDPVAAARLATARAEIATLSEEVAVPIENLMTPDLVRRVLWAPPETRDPAELTVALAETLADLGARSWQIGLVGPILVAAILEPGPLPPSKGAPEAPSDPTVD